MIDDDAGSEEALSLGSDQGRKKHSIDTIKTVSLRLLIWTLGLALVIALGLYGLAVTTGRSGAVGLTVLFAIPIIVGALGAYVSEINRANTAYRTAASIGVAVFVLGVIILREAVICIIMLAPIWLPLLFIGAFFVRVLFNQDTRRRKLYSVNFLALPFLTLIIDANVAMPIEGRTITREVVVNAPIDVVWNHLHDIDNIEADDGRWNITQDVLGMPRPVKAETVHATPRSIRTNYWSKGIWFEEHITEAAPNERLHWEFVYPDDSLRHKTDPHLDPRSHYFHIDTGGFDLESLDGETTVLKLRTNYIMQTPVNGYSALWGEFFLGDIQNNVLATVKSRSESSLESK
ncbi:MAG: hypothetical protein ABJ275_03680 [Maricaulaceae bacterium]